jgi:hypothetical protein
VPASSPTLLVTTYAYTTMGLVQDVTDPQGIVNRTLHHNLGRPIQTIQNYTRNEKRVGTRSSSSDCTAARRGRMAPEANAGETETLSTARWIVRGKRRTSLQRNNPFLPKKLRRFSLSSP